MDTLCAQWLIADAWSNRSDSAPRFVVSMRLAISRTILIVHLISFAVILAGVLVAFHYSWPDFVHTDHGFPFVWARHTTVTLLGPVDKWEVNLFHLALNIAVLMLISLSLSTTILWIISRLRHTLR